MFEFVGRDLKRLLGVEGQGRVSHAAAHREGLTGGDTALLELMDLRLLTNEARAADVAAGRIGCKDRAVRLLEAAVVWREVARRTGDAAALRKGAAQAEAAAKLADAERKPDLVCAARCEQAVLAMLGAELFGDEGLHAAAGATLSLAKTTHGPHAALAASLLAAVDGRMALSENDIDRALAAVQAFEAPLATLAGERGAKAGGARLQLAEQRAARIDLLLACAVHLKDRALVEVALAESRTALAALDPDFEPLTWSRLELLRSEALARLGDYDGELSLIADAVETATQALEPLDPGHSPLDWARAQASLGEALQAMGEATTSERCFEQAVTCYDRATHIVKVQPALTLRAAVANNRALSLARCAELTADLAVLDAAELAFKAELAEQPGARDPAGWAVVQMNLARLYEARVEITGRDDGRLDRAATALAVAFDVFAELGLRSLTDMAAQGLQRISQANAA
jgi:tetratricopeptide (TPR) repeat protein